MILPFTVNRDEFEVLNECTNIIYQSERKTFGDCELIMEQIIKIMFDEGFINKKGVLK